MQVSSEISCRMNWRRRQVARTNPSLLQARDYKAESRKIIRQTLTARCEEETILQACDSEANGHSKTSIVYSQVRGGSTTCAGFFGLQRYLKMWTTGRMHLRRINNVSAECSD